MSFLAYEWTFLKVFWAMLAFFAFVIVVWLIVMVLYDNFARHDHSGVAKAGWTILVIFLPFIGVLIYLMARPGTADRRLVRRRRLTVQASSSRRRLHGERISRLRASHSYR